MIKNLKVITSVLFMILLSLSVVTGTSFAQTSDAEIKFNQAKEHISKSEYRQAIKIYDEILEDSPNNISALKMKGIAQINQGDYTKALEQFFKILQSKPNDVISLVGMGVGFGYLGEYQEAQKYFERASEKKPDSTVIKNYKEFADKVIIKYPYTPTEKPTGLERKYVTSIPDWVKQIAKWWSEEQLEDSEFISALLYLIDNKIIQIPPVETQNNIDEKIPDWIKSNASWWADGTIDDDSFVQGIQFMIKNGSISINIQDTTEKTQKEIDHEFYLFKKYLRDISNEVSKEKRYIEFPNPSQDVIKKFLRDYTKWNFEEEVKIASERFPDPTYEIIDEAYNIHYNVFINDQPTGLPLNHVGTLMNSFSFWEQQNLSTNNQEAKMEFEITNLKHKANVWVTWVVRDIGDGVLGHAHLGKGVVEVTLGDYNCDGSFQLYDVNSVETIMTHELGHSIGLKHVEERENIMYPLFTPSYAYCLLN
jgi:tetratricopeptide (TPR) repeat protein